MLGRRRRRRANIDPVLGQRLVFLGAEEAESQLNCSTDSELDFYE